MMLIAMPVRFCCLMRWLSTLVWGHQRAVALANSDYRLYLLH